MRTKLSELRDALNILIGEMTKGEGSSTADIADEFIRREKRMLDLHHDEIQHMALMQLVNDVSRRRPSRSVDPGQGDLFSSYAGPQNVALNINGSKDKTRKSVYDLRIEEAVQWIKERRSARQREARDAIEIDNLVERARPFCKKGMTIRQGLLAAEEAERKA